MMRMGRAILGLAVLSATGCAGMTAATLEEILGGMDGMGMGGDVRGEIEWIDTRRREMEVGSSFGQGTRLFYDSRTQVDYGGRRYSVSSLEPGDRVSVQVERSRDGDRYARRISVERTVYDQGGRSGQVRSDRFDGRVSWVDTQRGRFELRSSRGTYLVSLPYNADRSTVDRFRRLRAGHEVRIQGELLGNGRVELERFL